MKRLLYSFNPWWETGYASPSIFQRDLYMAQIIKNLTISKEILFLAGLRRVGKSSLMKLAIHKLINEHHIAPSKVLFVSLDDFLLNDVSIFEILDQYRAIHKLPQSEKVYLFFDEITHQDQWQQQLKTLYDRENVHVVASSSNSSVFVDDRAFLTGRSKLIEVKPLDFDEWLIFKNIALKKVDSTLYASYFEDYLQAGGMPEYVLHGDRDYLKRLVEQLLYKDIIAKHNIKLKSVIQDLFLLLMERSGKQISINSISKILGVSPSNIVRYLDFFRDTFLISTIKRYGKTNEKILSPEKIYSGDLGLRNAYTGFRDKGALFENYVYLKIKETNPFYYYDKGIEIDFITDKYFAKQYLIECKYNSTMNEKQQQLFDSMELANKLIINGYNDLHKLAEIYP